MATPEELEQQLAALKAQNAELTKNVENYKASSGNDQALQKRLEELEASNKKAAEENRNMKLATAKAAAIQKYPFSAPFIGAIVAETSEEIETKAKEFHDASAAQRDAAIKEKETELAARWGQLPNGSVPGVLRQEEIEAEYAKAKEKKDPQGMLKAIWTAHLQRINK